MSESLSNNIRKKEEILAIIDSCLAQEKTPTGQATYLKLASVADNLHVILNSLSN
jgi:hypothetical protein